MSEPKQFLATITIGALHFANETEVSADVFCKRLAQNLADALHEACLSKGLRNIRVFEQSLSDPDCGVSGTERCYEFYEVTRLVIREK